jgi:hypothetical protein
MPSTLPVHRPDQPPQAQRPHPQLENNHGAGSQGARPRTHPSCQAKWMKKVADPAKKGHKKKTNKNKIHKSLLPRERNLG